MVQSSLFGILGRPSDPCLLQVWMERVRERIGSISRNIDVLDRERQELIGMIWSVERQYSSVDDPCAFSVNVLLSERQVQAASDDNVIDLFSELSESCQSSTGHIPQSPIRSEHTATAKSDMDFPTPEIPFHQSTPPEHDANLGNLLTPEPLPDLPQVDNGPGRVFKVQEYKMIDWQKVSVSDLKQWMDFFGLKSSNSRTLMVSQLEAIFDYLTKNSQSPPTPGNQSSREHKTDGDERMSREELFRVYSDIIKSNDEIYEKILLFESIEFSLIYDLIKSKNIKINNKLLKNFLEINSIQFNQQKNSPKNRKRRRVLRRSLTAP